MRIQPVILAAGVALAAIATATAQRFVFSRYFNKSPKALGPEEIRTDKV